MMNPQYGQERYVKTVINRYQQEAIHADQLKAARANHPGPLSVLTTTLRATLGHIMSAVHPHTGQLPAAEPVPEPTAEPLPELAWPDLTISTASPPVPA